MATVRDLRKRLKATKNTQKITKAMKMVAASKLKRAQDAIVAARPYALRMNEVLEHVLAHADLRGHPLLTGRTPKRAEVLILSSDRGLAGSFNSNIIRTAERYIAENSSKYEEIFISTIGKKARDHFKRKGRKILADYEGVTQKPSFDRADDIAHELAARFMAGEVDVVYLVYNEFKSAISQDVRVESLLPIVPTEVPEGGDVGGDFIYEPGKPELLDRLLPMYVEVEVFRGLLESVASEHGARMTAMDSATNNASDMIDRLTLKYNRARQAAITTELMEIIGGAEALKG